MLAKVSYKDKSYSHHTKGQLKLRNSRAKGVFEESIHLSHNRSHSMRSLSAKRDASDTANSYYKPAT